MYKFFGEPLKIITSKTTNQPLFRFDTKGEYITDDPEIIRRALGFFDYIEMKAEAVGEKVEKTHTVPPLIITTKDEKKKEYQCKYTNCFFETDNKGELLAHYKKEHKKEE